MIFSIWATQYLNLCLFPLWPALLQLLSIDSSFLREKDSRVLTEIARQGGSKTLLLLKWIIKNFVIEGSSSAQIKFRFSLKGLTNNKGKKLTKNYIILRRNLIKSKGFPKKCFRIFLTFGSKSGLIIAPNTDSVIC